MKIKKIRLAILGVLLIVAAVAIVYLFRMTEYTTITFHMDTYVSYSVRARNAEKLVMEMDAEFEKCEQLFSRFSSDSDISRINENAGEFTEVQKDTYDLMCEILELSSRTDGAFDPTVGKLVDLWGFGANPHVPDKDELDAALQSVNYRSIRYKEENGKYYVMIAADQIIDLGAVAKGYALRKVDDILNQHVVDYAVISLGGNVFIKGDKTSDSEGSFSVGIRCPEEESSEMALIISLKEVVLSTSGSYERFFYQDGIRYSHIIDPFTGRCDSDEILSVTIVCSDPVDADALSTAYYVKGLGETLDALSSGEIEGILIDSSKVIYISEDLFQYVDRDSIADGYTLEVVE